MPKTSAVFAKIVPGVVLKKGDSERRVIAIDDSSVTYEQLTSVKGPGKAGEQRTVQRPTFYNWARLAKAA